MLFDLASLTMLKPLTEWITINWKILQEFGIPDHLTCLMRNLYAGQEATVIIGVEQWTGSKFEKEYAKDIYCSPAYLTFMQHQFSSVAQSCPTLCDTMNRSTPGLPVHHHLPESTQTHVRGRDAIQPSYPLSSPSPPAPNPSKHQSLFQ